MLPVLLLYTQVLQLGFLSKVVTAFVHGIISLCTRPSYAEVEASRLVQGCCEVVRRGDKLRLLVSTRN